MSARNVLLIVADQWRGDFMPGPGRPWLALPNIERLCARGTSFARHYSGASPCGPARASLMTGMYAMNHRVVQNKIPMDDGITSLGVELRRAGRFTALIGYSDWLPDPRTTTAADPRYRGFGANIPGWAVQQSMIEQEFEAYFGHLRHLGYALPQDPFDIWRPGATLVDAAHSDTAWATDAALRFLLGRDGKPFVLHLGYWRPHPPFAAPAPFRARAAAVDLPGPRRAATLEAEPSHPFLAYLRATSVAADYIQGAAGLTRDLPPQAIMTARSDYLGLILELDHHIGRVLDQLERTGEIDRTLIILTSDHGELLGDRYLLGKVNHLDPAFHVPCVVCDPDVPQASRGRVVQHFSESVDLMPTVLSWLDIAIPSQCDGRSLLPFCRGETPAGWRDAAHFEFDFRDMLEEKPQRALGLGTHECGIAMLRDERFKYTHFAALPPILTDLARDPHEGVNVADDPAYAAVVSQYAQRLLSFRMAYANRTLTSYSGSPDGLIRR
jgi:arylsulfatase A-like enzyme